MDDDKLVVLAKVLNPGAAHMIRGLMESNDIDCVVFDDNAAGVGMGVREIRIMVRQENLMPAQRILKENEQS